MPTLNSVHIMAHLGRDAETRHTQSGKSITSFSLPLTFGTKEKPMTAWVNCKAWNQPQSVQDMRKGQLVELTGRIEEESWDDKKTGEHKSKLVIVADMISFPQWEKRESKGVDFASRHRSAQTTRPAGQQQTIPQTSDERPPWNTGSQEIDDSDVPF